MVSWFRGAGRCFCSLVLILLSLFSASCVQLPVVSKQATYTQSDTVLQFVTRQALIAAVLDVTSGSLKSWQQSSLGANLSEALAAPLDSLGIDFTEEIRPWLGNSIAFAITDKDLDRDSQNGFQAGYLLVAEISDSERLREFLELFWQRQSVAGAKLRFVQTNGVPLIGGATHQTAHQLSTAVVGDHTLLIANDFKVLRQSLRVAQSPQLHMSAPDCCASFWITLRIPSLMDWLGVAVPAKQRFLDARQWQSLTAAAVLRSQDITINTRLMPAGGSKAEDHSLTLDSGYQQNLKLRQYLPSSMAWASVGHNLSPLWSTLQAELNFYQKVPPFLQQFQQWQATSIGGKLVEPVSQLLADDYGVGQLSDGSWIMVTTPIEPRVANQLDTIATEEGLTVSQLTLNGHTVTAWSQLKTLTDQDSRHRETKVETDLMALRAKVDDCEVFATSLSGLTAALEAPGQSLSSTQRFRRAMQAIDGPNQEYIYGTWNEIERLLASKRWFSLVHPIVQPWKQSIDAIAITDYRRTDHQLTGTISVLLKK